MKRENRLMEIAKQRTIQLKKKAEHERHYIQEATTFNMIKNEKKNNIKFEKLNVKKLLNDRVQNELSELLNEMHTEIKQSVPLQECIDYYLFFQNTISTYIQHNRKPTEHAKDDAKDDPQSDPEEKVCCAVLCQLMKKELSAATTTNQHEEEEEEEEVDWSAMLEDTTSTTMDTTISWDITTSNLTDTSTDEEDDVSSKLFNPPLSSASERFQVLSDLEEMEIFYRSRIYEEKMDNENGKHLIRTISTMTKTKEILKKESELKLYLKTVDSFIAKFQNSSFQKLIMISKNGKGFENIVSTFDGIHRRWKKCVGNIDRLCLEEMKLMEKLKKDAPILLFYRIKLKRNKLSVEKCMNENVLLNGNGLNTFHLMGELNTI